MYHLTGGVNVEQRRIQSLLSAEQYDQYLQKKADNRAVSDYQVEESQAFYSYNTVLRKADFAYSRWDYYARKGKSRGKQRMEATYTQLYEQAFERLSEILSEQPHLNDWLDRPFSNTPESAPTCDAEAAPRVITSSSARNQARGKLQRSDAVSVKTDVVAQALYELRYGDCPIDDDSDRKRLRLQQFLQLPNEDR